MKAKTSITKATKGNLPKGNKTVGKFRFTKTRKISTTVKKIVKRKAKTASKVTKVIQASGTKTEGKKEANRKQQTVKLRRERVPESNFLFREFSWSSWKPAFSGSCPSKHWVKRKPGIGYRNDSLFKPKRNQTVLFELSVSVQPGSWKVVVYRMYSTKEGLITNIERHLKSKHIKSRLHNILKEGCVVYVRRLALTKRNANRVIDGATKRYSYLWDPDCTRQVVKNEIEL